MYGVFMYIIAVSEVGYRIKGHKWSNNPTSSVDEELSGWVEHIFSSRLWMLC